MINKDDNMRGLFVVFEGIDGTGKSTQQRLLAEVLRNRGYEVIETREPTEGKFGQKIRDHYLSRNTLSPARELELFIADRKEHIQKEILPALRAGKIALCDRYFLSTAAYQGAAGLDPEEILALHAFAPAPDLVLIIELDPVESIRRITQKRGDRLNDFEQLEALQKVDGIFKQMKLPYIRRINGSAPKIEVHRQVLSHVDSLLQSADPTQNAPEHL
jgi:dTMP kinase